MKTESSSARIDAPDAPALAVDGGVTPADRVRADAIERARGQGDAHEAGVAPLSGPRAAQGGRAVSALSVVMLVLLGVLSYAGRLGGPFLFDDAQSIVDNPSLVPFDVLRALTPPRETPVAARPLVNLSFAVDAALHGLSPGAFHTTNLLVHLACALLAFAVLCRLFEASALPGWLGRWPALPAFLAAAAFCAHPLASEVVLYATQRSESLVALCYLGALWLLTREARSGARSWPWLLVLGVLGAASKEVFVTAPLVLLACDRAFYAGSLREALRRRPAFHAAAAASLVPVLLLQHGAPRSESVRLFELEYLSAQARIVPGYVWHALWPAQPVLDYGPLWPGQHAQAWAWLASPLMAALALCIWRWPRRGFVALWVCAILAPTSSVLSIHTELGAERRFYLPLLGIVAGLALLLCACAARRLQPRAAGWLLALGLLVSLGLAALTRQHALVYRDVRSYWQAAVAARPENARAHYNLAETLRREGAPEEAMRAFSQALALQPDYTDAHANLSGLLIARGALAEGLAHAERAAALAPGSPGVHYNLALACAFNGQLARALAELEITVRLEPRHWEAHRRLAQGYLAAGRREEAGREVGLLLARDPRDQGALRVAAQL